MKSKKAQLSLEFLLVFAALTAFLSVFLPVYSTAQNSLKLKAIETTQEIALQKTYGIARQAQVLGFESSLNAEIILQANETELKFDEAKGELQMSFTHAGISKTISQKTSFPIEIETPAKLEKGKYSVQAKGGTPVVLNVERQE
ncbi:MAG TPA: hypothetical protein VJI71_02235 [Candidatus Norongarragalinales archaeon]|nr:hypothetical protein [Candidatus Norongarragalinales archaeon]